MSLDLKNATAKEAYALAFELWQDFVRTSDPREKSAARLTHLVAGLGGWIDCAEEQQLRDVEQIEARIAERGKSAEG